jgi:hypothetical protein
MTRFNDAIQKFQQRLAEQAGINAQIIRNGTKIFDVVAIPEKTKVEYLTDKGVRASNTVYDFCVSTKYGWTPERGDRLLWGEQSYIVRPVGSEWWMYDDAEKVFMRVHTQLEV